MASLHRDPIALGAIFLGGALGTLLRYLVPLAVAAVSQMPDEPRELAATCAVNIIVAFLLGLITGIWAGRKAGPDSRNGHLKIFLGTGFCGGFTTYGTFVSQGTWLVYLAPSFGVAGYARAFTYIFGSLGVGFAAAWLGVALGARLAPKRGERA